MKKFLTFILAAVFCCLALACGDEEASVIDGNVVTYDGKSLEITVDNSANYSFTLEDAELHGSDNAVPGNPVRVEYKGKLDKKNLEQKVEVTAVTFSSLDNGNEASEASRTPDSETADGNDQPDSSQNSQPPATQVPPSDTGDNGEKSPGSAGEKTIQGRVTEITMETVVLDTSDGTYTFNIEATGITGDDLNIGDKLAISYNGELEPQAEIIAVTVEKQ